MAAKKSRRVGVSRENAPRSKPRATTARDRAGAVAVKTALSERKCVPCEGGVPALTNMEISKLAKAVPGWRVVGAKLHRHLDFDDFTTLMEFVNDMASLAEEEGHHPDFCVSYDKLDVDLWTHAIGGLSDNDFILAAKIDKLLGSRP